MLPSLAADAGVREAWEHTARAAADLGARVIDVSMPSVPQVGKNNSYFFYVSLLPQLYTKKEVVTEGTT